MSGIATVTKGGRVCEWSIVFRLQNLFSFVKIIIMDKTRKNHKLCYRAYFL